MWNDPEVPAAHYFMKSEPEKKISLAKIQRVERH